jgi:hypothetical protein
LANFDLGGEVRTDEVVIDPEEDERNTDQGQDHEGKRTGKLFANFLEHKRVFLVWVSGPGTRAGILSESVT